MYFHMILYPAPRTFSCTLTGAANLFNSSPALSPASGSLCFVSREYDYKKTFLFMYSHTVYVSVYVCFPGLFTYVHPRCSIRIPFSLSAILLCLLITFCLFTYQSINTQLVPTFILLTMMLHGHTCFQLFFN